MRGSMCVVAASVCVVAAGGCGLERGPVGRAAPAPLARRDAPRPITDGAWRLMFEGAAYTAEFRPGGGYRAGREGGRDWVGTWTIEETGELFVDERHEASGNRVTWRLRFHAGKWRSVGDRSIEMGR